MGGGINDSVIEKLSDLSVKVGAMISQLQGLDNKADDQSILIGQMRQEFISHRHEISMSVAADRQVVALLDAQVTGLTKRVEALETPVRQWADTRAGWKGIAIIFGVICTVVPVLTGLGILTVDLVQTLQKLL